MKRYLLAVLCLSPSLAMGGSVLDERAFVGRWVCYFSELDIRSTSVVEYRRDGTMSDSFIMHEGKRHDNAYRVDTAEISGRWRVSGDKLISYDHTIQSYAVDMPNYHKIERFSGKNKTLMMAIQTRMAKAEAQRLLAGESVNRVKFLNKHTFISAHEDFDDDFPTDIENNHCKRL